jgi:subtilisin
MAIHKQYRAIGAAAIAVLIAGVLALGATASQANNAPERFIVTFEEGGIGNEAAREALENKGAKVLKELGLINGFVVLVPEEALANVSALAGVKAVEKDVRVYAQKPPGGCEPWPDCKNGGGDDGGGGAQPAQTLEWGVDRIDAELAWSTSRGAGVKIAIIDSGISLSHPDLVVAGGINIINSQKSYDDDNGHGSHVAGIAAALDNSIGVVGVAPEAELYAVKALNRRGIGFTSDIIAGIGWAAANGMQVINMSLGSDSPSAALESAVNEAYSAGIVIVAAAGNSGESAGSNVIYPARYNSVIAVAASDIDNNRASFSSTGPEVEFAAPGKDINSTWKGDGYHVGNGTSMASPHTAGTVALMLAVAIPAGFDADSDGVWDPAEVHNALAATADDLGTTGHDNFYGYGLVDAEEATTGSETN